MNSQAAPPRRWSWATLATLVWTAITMIAAIKLAAAPQKHSVFPVYIAGVTDWLEGKPVYVERPGLDLYRYPPPSLPLFAILKPFGLSLGSALWTLAGSASLFAAAEALRKKILPGGDTWSDRQVGAYRMAVLLMAARSIWNAQANTAVGALLMGGLAFACQKLTGPSIPFALALFIKPTVLPIILLPCARKPLLGAMTAASAMVLAVVLSVPLTVEGAELWKQWVGHGRASAGERRVAFRDGWTALVAVEAALRGNLPELDASYPRWWLPVSAATAGLALLFCLTRRCRRDPGAEIAQAGLLGTAWLLLMGPAIEPPTYLLLGPWLGWAVASGVGTRLALAALACGIASLVLPGTPTIAAMAWTPALLPFTALLVAAWALTIHPDRAKIPESPPC
jgi:hypothetical protein